MFKLLRWLCLVAVIVALVGALVTVRVRGSTPAEGACKLWGNPACLSLASHVAVQFQAAERRLLARSGGQQAARRDERPVAVRGHGPIATPPPPAAEPLAAPLDRHTPEERHALDRILSHGSK